MGAGESIANSVKNVLQYRYRASQACLARCLTKRPKQLELGFFLMALRLAIITDLHAGRDTGNVKGPLALEILESFVTAAHDFEPDAVLELGDRLTDENPEVDRARLLELARVFKRLPYPRHHLNGNHDLLPKTDQEAILDTNLGNHAVEIGGWKLLFLDTFNGTTGGALTAQTLEWLELELGRSALPVVVFSHQPLHGQWLRGNPYFESDFRDHACPLGAGAARAILEQHPLVRLCVSGHAHWNDHRVVGSIPYITLLSATESHWTAPLPSRAYAFLSLSDEIKLEVRGLEPVTYQF